MLTAPYATFSTVRSLERVVDSTSESRASSQPPCYHVQRRENGALEYAGSV